VKREPGEYVAPKVRLVRKLAAGGMGEIWVAEHEGIGAEVAVKFLLGEASDDPNLRARFAQEAAASSRVKSSHVVKVYDYGVTDTNVPFIVMELLDGTDLGARIATEGKLAPAALLPIVKQLCSALERAHAQGVVHRDIKPENVFLTQEGGDVFVKLLDFGIAKTVSGNIPGSTGRRSTVAGETLGTPFYMSPEQFRSSKHIDLRSDLWSVGVLVYEALTGQLPYTADTIAALAIVVNEGLALRPTEVEPSLPRTIDDWFARACARKPEDRFTSARDLWEALALAFGDPMAVSGPVPSVVPSQPRVVVPARSEPRITADGMTTSVDDLGLRQTVLGDSVATAPLPRRANRTWLVGGLVGFVALGVVVFALVNRTSHAHASDQAAPPTSSVAPIVTAVADTASTPQVVASIAVAPSASVLPDARRDPGRAPIATGATKPSPRGSNVPAAGGTGARDIW
jgi:serine/threonine-protein kinase